MHPIFLYGDSIQGTLNMRLLKAEKLSHRGITAKIVRYCYNGSNIISENTLYTQCLDKKGNIRNELSAFFKFDNVQMDGETYLGKKYSIQYSVVVTIARSIVSDIVISAKFAYLRPVPPPQACYPAVLSFDKSDMVIAVELEKRVYSRDEVLKGKVTVDRISPFSVSKLYLQIIATDWIDKTGKGNDSVICNYELLDGTPRPGITAPFALQLKPLNLWSSSPDEGTAVQIQHRIDVVAIRSDGEKCIASQRIGIYQELIPQ